MRSHPLTHTHTCISSTHSHTHMQLYRSHPLTHTHTCTHMHMHADKVDYTVSPQLVTISSTAPSVIEVDTFLDGLALELDEQFTLRLEPVGGSAPRGLRESLTVTLVDSDGESNLKSSYSSSVVLQAADSAW